MRKKNSSRKLKTKIDFNYYNGLNMCNEESLNFRKSNIEKQKLHLFNKQINTNILILNKLV